MPRPDPAQQEAILEARMMRARDMSLRAIADSLRDKGHRTSHVGVSNVLQREANKLRA